MIDVRRLRDDLANLTQELGRKGVPAEAVAEAAQADARWRQANAVAEELRHRRREGSRLISRAAPAERQALVDEMRDVAARADEAERDLAVAADAARHALVNLPNPPDPATPEGGAEDYRVLRSGGDAAPLGPGQLDHAALGEPARLWEAARATRMSGSRFCHLLHVGTLLEQALIGRALAGLVRAGFELTVPPILVREPAMFGTGFFPAERSEYYEVDNGQLFLVGTSEVPLAAYHADEVLEDLPARRAALSSCFRREAGAYGRDTTGIFRVHQFTKVEMFVCADPTASAAEHEAILAIQEELVAGLEIPYRIIDTAARDLGASAARKFDIEAWLPSEGRYREITSTSNCTDFQARRLNIRCSGARGRDFVHTLNGTAMTDRWLLFIAEHYQQPDGSIAVPAVLEPHLLAPLH
ncbi:MAG: serine--tRNA ligase [Acidimicrobiales bacterium]